MRIAAAILALASAGAILTLSTETALAEESRQVIAGYASFKSAAPEARAKPPRSMHVLARSVLGSGAVEIGNKAHCRGADRSRV
jgi:hypothetical protein